MNGCKICGKRFKSLTNTHLNIHNITQKEYKEKYPNAIISWNTGLTKHTDERVNKLSKSKFRNDEWKLKVFTEERNNKISLKLKNKPKTSEHNNKVSQSLMGHEVSLETRNKIRNGRIGKTLSDKQKKNIYGERHQDYINKTVDSYFTQEFRAQIRNRDGDICMKCACEKSYDINLDVHHINYTKLTMKENCIILCRGCHLEVHRTPMAENKKRWMIFFQSILSERYGYNYSNNKIVIEVLKR